MSPPPSLSLPHLRSSLSSVLDPLSPQPFKLIWASHPRWPLSPPSRTSLSSSSTPPTPTQKGRIPTISILDSSWNPPTNAHLSLVTAPLPGFEGGEEEGEYDAHLLLLSVKNVDKTLKSSDATFEQRLQMIHLLATSLLSSSSSSPTSSSPPSHSNLAIGILSEPAFIAKDVVVRSFLKQHAKTLEQNDGSEEERKQLERGQTRLAWLVGTDTLWRFFDAKYYPTSHSLTQTLSPFFTPSSSSSSSSSPPHPGSLLIHFPRLPSPPAPPSFDLAVLESLPKGSVRVGRSRDGKDWGRVSSTVVRRRIKEGWRLEEGEDGLELVGEEMRGYLEREGLYR